MPQKKMGAIAIAATVAIIAAFIIAATSTVQRRHHFNDKLAQQRTINLTICKRVNKVYLIIQKQIRQGEKDLNKISYYKTHPKEKALILRRSEDEYKAFAPKPC